MASWTEKPKAKNKNKPPKPTKAQLAFREYERISFYLATQGIFDFSMDDDARHFMFAEDAEAIGLCSANRLSPDEGTNYKVPKGDHIDGLAVRTKERERVMGKKQEKQPSVKKPKKATAKDEGSLL